MERGILKVGDKVRYNSTAKEIIPEWVDNKEHVVSAISKDLAIAYFNNRDSSHVYWIELCIK